MNNMKWQILAFFVLLRVNISAPRIKNKTTYFQAFSFKHFLLAYIVVLSIPTTR
jgi:hypothetical protein